MNLRDLTPKTSSATMGKLLESYFQKKTRFSALNESAAKQMLTKVNKMVAEYKATSKRHNSEKDQTYLGLMFMQEGLKKRLSELATPAQAAKPVTAQNIANPTSPGMKKAVDAIKGAQSGKTLNGQQGAEVAGLAAMKSAATPGNPNFKNPAFKKAAEKGIKGQPLNQAETGLLAQVATESTGDDIADRKREQEENDWYGEKTKKTSTNNRRKIAGKNYGGSASKDNDAQVDEATRLYGRNKNKGDQTHSRPYKNSADAEGTEKRNAIAADARMIRKQGQGKQLNKPAGTGQSQAGGGEVYTSKAIGMKEDSIDDAMADFKKRGGKVKQLPPGKAKNPISTASHHIGGRGEAKGGHATRVGKKANTGTSKPVAGETSANSISGKYGYGKGVYEGASIQASFNNLYHRFLAEGADVDQAQVVLAAQDMVDSVQDMLEKVGKMKIDELFPLTDSIKSALGTDKAAAFSQAVDAALQTILDSLQGARTELSNSVAALTGEEVDPGFADAMGAEGEEDGLSGLDGLDAKGGEEGMGDIDPAADLGLDQDAEAEPLGRDRRE